MEADRSREAGWRWEELNRNRKEERLRGTLIKCLAAKTFVRSLSNCGQENASDNIEENMEDLTPGCEGTRLIQPGFRFLTTTNAWSE
jgi:hypothetical protein